MVRSSRRRTKAAPASKLPDDDEDFQDDDDEDDEEDDFEFVPGADDDDDDDEDDGVDNNDSIAGILDGHLYYDEKDQILHYQGDSFHLTASMKRNAKDPKSSSEDSLLLWNPLQDPPPSSNMATYQMKGTISPPATAAGGDDDDQPKKLPLRIFDMTWTVQHDGHPLAPTHHDKNSCPGKKVCDSGEDDDEEGDAKQKPGPKPPGVFYHVMGREVESATHENVLIQFQGGFYPPKNSDSTKMAAPKGEKEGGGNSPTTIHSVPLNCQFQYVLSEAPPAAAAAASASAAAAPPAAAAARKSASYADDDDDDDDLEADADEDMNYNELIALHEDAGMDVEALKRRYQQSANKNQDDDDDDDGKPAPKKFKAAPDDDDDDDVGF